MINPYNNRAIVAIAILIDGRKIKSPILKDGKTSYYYTDFNMSRKHILTKEEKEMVEKYQKF